MRRSGLRSGFRPYGSLVLAPLVQTFKPKIAAQSSEPAAGSVGSAPPAQCTGDFGNGVGRGVAGWRGTDAKSLHRVLATDPRFDTRNLLTGVVSLPGNKYPEWSQTTGFARLVGRIRSLPGVQEAAAVTVRCLRECSRLRFGRTSQEQAAARNTNAPHRFGKITLLSWALLLRVALLQFAGQEKSPITHRNPMGNDYQASLTRTSQKYTFQILGVVGNENVDSLPDTDPDTAAMNRTLLHISAWLCAPGTSRACWSRP